MYQPVIFIFPSPLYMPYNKASVKVSCSCHEPTKVLYILALAVVDVVVVVVVVVVASVSITKLAAISSSDDTRDLL
jgi:hypothetical protein